MEPDQYAVESLSELISPEARKLLEASGQDVVRQIGIDVVRGAVLDILSGRNLRDTTELLTRRRLASLNIATVMMFFEGLARSDDFVERLPYLATSLLSKGKISKSERWLAQWILGLNDKAFQNVLRDSTESLADYRDRYIHVCKQVIADAEQTYGPLSGTIQLSPELKAEINWLFMVYLMNTIGAQTLAIRGSEKSAYGKLFERLVLGALLHILGFKYTTPDHSEEIERVFWLSSREKRRESDATLLYEVGKGVRFDIGFIGRGNPEISLDKVTRFEREIDIGRTHWYMATIIIVDRIGKQSRIEELAKAADGTIIQMSASYWIQQVARELHRTLGFTHEVIDMNQAQIHTFLKQNIALVPLEQFIASSED
jgi:hypothetical protein